MTMKTLVGRPAMTAFRSPTKGALVAVCLCTVGLSAGTLRAQTDPGPRGGAANAGGPAAGLGADEVGFFYSARNHFQVVYSVSGGIAGEEGTGLGPAFNGNSCAMCHTEPATGGSSPHPTLGQRKVPNPQVALASLDRLPGQEQIVPPFITANGPIRAARFIALSSQNIAPLDGRLHDLYTIAGRIDAGACNLAQPNFVQQLTNTNVVFRIPTPVFGLGLVENTADATLQANLAANSAAKAAAGIHGTLNTSEDGTVTRFGWKAQGKSLLTVTAEHANAEVGLSNEGAPSKRSAAPACVFNPTPEDSTNIHNPSDGTLTGSASDMSSDVVNDAMFARLSAAPIPTTSSGSELNGSVLFTAIGCNLCHSTDLTTGASRFPGQSDLTYHPYSDFALHHMGATLADGVVQGAAGPDMFRTAPLWGVGQRIFFLHDGRTSSLLDAIAAHSSPGNVCAASETLQRFRANGTLHQPLITSFSCGSEANGVVANFNALSPQQQQDVVNFLRSL